MSSTNQSEIDILGKRLQKNADVVSRKIADEFFLIPIKGNLADMEKIFTLNRVGEYIWQQLGHQKTLEAIRDGVMANFEVGREEAESDIREFVGELLDAGLIRE